MASKFWDHKFCAHYKNLHCIWCTAPTENRLNFLRLDFCGVLGLSLFIQYHINVNIGTWYVNCKWKPYQINGVQKFEIDSNWIKSVTTFGPIATKKWLNIVSLEVCLQKAHSKLLPFGAHGVQVLPSEPGLTHLHNFEC